MHWFEYVEHSFRRSKTYYWLIKQWATNNGQWATHTTDYYVLHISLFICFHHRYTLAKPNTSCISLVRRSIDAATRCWGAEERRMNRCILDTYFPIDCISFQSTASVIVQPDYVSEFVFCFRSVCIAQTSTAPQFIRHWAISKIPTDRWWGLYAWIFWFFFSSPSFLRKCSFEQSLMLLVAFKTKPKLRFVALHFGCECTSLSHSTYQWVARNSISIQCIGKRKIPKWIESHVAHISKPVLWNFSLNLWFSHTTLTLHSAHTHTHNLFRLDFP